MSVAAAWSPESLHPLHCSELHAMELLLPAVIMDLGLDESVWVRHGVWCDLLNVTESHHSQRVLL